MIIPSHSAVNRMLCFALLFVLLPGASAAGSNSWTFAAFADNRAFSERAPGAFEDELMTPRRLVADLQIDDPILSGPESLQSRVSSRASRTRVCANPRTPPPPRAKLNVLIV